MLELANKTQPPNTSSVLEQPPENDDARDDHFSDESNADDYVAPIQSTPINNSSSSIKRKLILLSPLLMCLYILTDTTHHNYAATEEALPQKQHLAFITALSRHPPALRVFRIVSESAFLLFCTAFALWAWETCNDSKGSSSSVQSNEEFLDQCSKQTTTVTISSETVGKLLFAPPPNSITQNAAWMVYQKHHHRLLFRRKRRKGRIVDGENGRRAVDGMSRNNEEDLIELQQQQPPDDNDDDGHEDLVSPLMMDTSTQQDLSDDRNESRNENGDEDDDNYIENDQNDNRTAFEETLTASSAPILPKPPSSTSVLGAALDITTFMCMFLIFFTISSAEGGRYIDHRARGGININPTSSSSNHITDEIEDHNNNNNNNEISYMKFVAKIAAPLFPITLFLLSALLLIIPWRKRKVLWTIVSLTLGAPFYEVTFRDGFIGDILTSTVRPLQDLAYTVVFLFLGLQSWWDSQAYNNNDDSTAGSITTSTTLDDVPLERSWLLHTFVLPACTLSPLWWRFLQNLRQSFDHKQRWPYLGNAFKYMLAAEVAIFGMFDPSVKHHPVWILCFFCATLYQVWWDVFMDWGLLVWDEDEVTYQYYHSNGNNSSSSGGGNGRKGLLWWWPYKLRSQRAYPHRWIYYTIFTLNFCLRFVGMLTLIPPVYLSRQTGLIVNTWYDPDFQLFVGSLAASAEIFRRTIWALLRLEWEVIKTTKSSSSLMPSGTNKGESSKGEDDDLLDLLEEETDMKPMAIASSSSSDRNGGIRLGFSTTTGGNHTRPRRISLATLSDMSNLNSIQILSELCAWATIFTGIAIIAAAHREVL